VCLLNLHVRVARVTLHLASLDHSFTVLVSPQAVTYRVGSFREERAGVVIAASGDTPLATRSERVVG
jgi:hypothetical protein